KHRNKPVSSSPCSPRPSPKVLNLAAGVFVVSVVSRFAAVEGFHGRSGRFATLWMLPACCRSDAVRPSPTDRRVDEEAAGTGVYEHGVPGDGSVRWQLARHVARTDSERSS